MNRMWSWLIPGVGAGFLFVAVLFIGARGDVNAQYCGGGMLVVMALLFVQAWAEFRSAYREEEVRQFVEKRHALADTAENRLADALRGMHPETVRQFFRHRIEVWRTMEMGKDELFLAVLDADPRITYSFLEHVLRHSNFYALMPKRLLSDKAHRFDPRRLFTDYEQYDALTGLFERRGWLTAGYGNQPGAWIEPWNPGLVARKFGITLEAEDDEAAESEIVEKEH